MSFLAVSLGLYLIGQDLLSGLILGTYLVSKGYITPLHVMLTEDMLQSKIEELKDSFNKSIMNTNNKSNKSNTSNKDKKSKNINKNKQTNINLYESSSNLMDLDTL